MRARFAFTDTKRGIGRPVSRPLDNQSEGAAGEGLAMEEPYGETIAAMTRKYFSIVLHSNICFSEMIFQRHSLGAFGARALLFHRRATL